MAAVVRSIRRSKFHVRTDAAGKAARTIDGILFASLKEAKRYGQLKLLQKAGKISELETQPRFPLHALTREQTWIEIGSYVADFRYRDGPGPLVVEDAKGHRTELFNWKLKHVECEYGIKVRLT